MLKNKIIYIGKTYRGKVSLRLGFYSISFTCFLDIKNIIFVFIYVQNYLWEKQKNTQNIELKSDWPTIQFINQ